MNSKLALERCRRTIVAIVAIVATTAIVLAATVALAAPAGGAVTVPPTCAGGATTVWFGGQWYCPGYVIGVQKNAYGAGKHVVLFGVSVTDVRGTTATVSGGPSCLPPSAFCGATVPEITVSLTGLTARPAAGTSVDLYGITGSSTLSATGFIVRSSGGCTNPDFC